MIASSMTIPTASVSPSKVIELSVKSITFNTVKVVMIEVGIAIELINTVRQSRMKIQMMSEASKLPSTRCSSSAATEERM